MQDEELEQVVNQIQLATDLAAVMLLIERFERTISPTSDPARVRQQFDQIASAARSRGAELEKENERLLADSVRRVKLMERAAEFDESVITVEFLKEIDGTAAWIRDDYLSMRGIESEPKRQGFLNRVAEVKAQARKEGVLFSA